jgi:hypothetical protein
MLSLHGSMNLLGWHTAVAMEHGCSDVTGLDGMDPVMSGIGDKAHGITGYTP